MVLNDRPAAAGRKSGEHHARLDASGHRIAATARMKALAARRQTMAEHDHSAIREHMTVVGADGVHVGTVDHLDGERIKLTKGDSPQNGDGEGARHHYLPAGLVAAVEGDIVRLSANAANEIGREHV